MILSCTANIIIISIIKNTYGKYFNVFVVFVAIRRNEKYRINERALRTDFTRNLRSAESAEKVIHLRKCC